MSSQRSDDWRMAIDRLSQLASTSADLTEMLKQLRGDGLAEEVGRDRLLDADSTDEVLDEFLSVAVREVSDQVIFGLALSLPICILRRGVGQAALDYCLAHRALLEDERTDIRNRLSNLRGVNESICEQHQRLRSYAGFSGDTAFYHTFLVANIAEVLAECPDKLADYLLDPQFGPEGYNVDCMVVAIQHSPDPEPFIRHWIKWLGDGLFDKPRPPRGATTIMYAALDDHAHDPRFATIADAAHVHVVRILGSSGNVGGTWWHLRGLLEQRYKRADEVVSTIRRSGVPIDETKRQVLQYQLRALVALADGSAGGKSYYDWMSLVSENGPPGST